MKAHGAYSEAADDRGAGAADVPSAAGPVTPPGAHPPYEVGMLESGGIQLYYEIHGHGPRVLVFMHGILMDSNMNRRLAVDLAGRGYRVVLLDLPGHGLSEKPKRASFHRMDTYAEHVVALMDHLGIDTAVVGGVSLGRECESAGGGHGAPSGSRVWSSRCRCWSGPCRQRPSPSCPCCSPCTSPGRWSAVPPPCSGGCPAPATVRSTAS